MTINNQLLNSYTEGIDKNIEDLKIFSIKQKLIEGEYAFVEILVKQRSITKSKILLSFEEETFFKGTLLKAPEPLNKGVMKLTYIAKPEGIPEINLTAKESFFENITYSDFHLPAVHPVTHEQYAISFFALQHKEAQNLTPFIFSKSITIEQIKSPIRKFNLHIAANWLQQNNGIFDIFPFIKNRFPNNSVCTLTGKSFKASFPLMGEKISSNNSNSGYSVVYCKLQEEFVTNTFLKTETGILKIPFYKFRGQFLIQWELSYKRQEDIFCSISYNPENGDFSLFERNVEAEPEDSIALNIKDSFLNKEQGNFFDTDLGKKSLEQGLLQMCYKIIRSHFDTLIHFKIPFSKGLSLQCGDVVSIEHNNKTIRGYIGFIEHNINEYQMETKVSFFVINHSFDKEKLMAFIEKAKVHFNLIGEQKPPDVFDNTENICAKDFIEEINIFNAAQEQKDGLSRLAEKNINSIKTFLKKHPTVLNIQLKDLRNNGKKVKTYKIEGA